MKVGKEGIAGTIAALRAWGKRDHDAVRQRETGHLNLWRDGPGAGSRACAAQPWCPTPPTTRSIGCWSRSLPADAGTTAWVLTSALAAGDPPVIVRDHEVEHGHFYLDPCNLQATARREIVAGRLVSTLKGSNAARFQEAGRKGMRETLMSWPD